MEINQRYTVRTHEDPTLPSIDMSSISFPKITFMDSRGQTITIVCSEAQAKEILRVLARAYL